jgi:hypothetical protein
VAETPALIVAITGGGVLLLGAIIAGSGVTPARALTPFNPAADSIWVALDSVIAFSALCADATF